MSSIASKSRVQNEIVSRSSEIDDRLARALCTWSPCRGQLAFGRTESYNFFRPDDKTLAIARSMRGELEHSRYGGRHIVSQVVVLDREQLSGYHDNIVLLVRMLNSMGLLSLRLRIPDQLPSLELPDYSLPAPDQFERADLAAETQKILRAINIHQHVVILGLENPMAFLCAVPGRHSRYATPENQFRDGIKSDGRAALQSSILLRGRLCPREGACQPPTAYYFPATDPGSRLLIFGSGASKFSIALRLRQS